MNIHMCFKHFKSNEIIDFKTSWKMCQQLKVLECHKKHHIIRLYRKGNIRVIFFAISAHGITILDHQSWISLHLFVCCGFKCMNMLLTFQSVVEGNGQIQFKTLLV